MIRSDPRALWRFSAFRPQMIRTPPARSQFPLGHPLPLALCREIPHGAGLSLAPRLSAASCRLPSVHCPLMGHLEFAAASGTPKHHGVWSAAFRPYWRTRAKARRPNPVILLDAQRRFAGSSGWRAVQPRVTAASGHLSGRPRLLEYYSAALHSCQARPAHYFAFAITPFCTCTYSLTIARLRLDRSVVGRDCVGGASAPRGDEREAGLRGTRRSRPQFPPHDPRRHP